LPLAQRKHRQLVNANEKKFRALILVNVVLALAVAEARGRTVLPRDQVLRFLKTLVKLARDVSTEIVQQRLLELGERAPKQQRVGVRVLVRLDDRFHQQRLRFARACSATEQTIFRGRRVKLLLLGEWRVSEIDSRGLERGRGFNGAVSVAAAFSDWTSCTKRSTPDVIVTMGGCRNSKCETRNE
jgi:hypothetical protein